MTITTGTLEWVALALAIVCLIVWLVRHFR